MNKHLVRTPDAALVYLTECTLATVESNSVKKTGGKYEKRRQIEIAQSGIDWIRGFKIEARNLRVGEVIGNFDGNVRAWSDRYNEPATPQSPQH